MKSNLIIGLSFMLAACCVLYACQKQLSPSKASPSLSASTTSAATGEKITLNVNNIPQGTHLAWASTSPANAVFNASVQGSSVVSFTKPGTYKITCYIMSGDGADSIPVCDTSSHNPYDTIPNYPPPHDTMPNYPHDTVPNYPHDTVPNYPHDTTPNYPHDTTPNYPHDTMPGYPHDTTPNYPHDTMPNYPPPPPPHDSSRVDSTGHASNNHVIATLTIIITVR